MSRHGREEDMVASPARNRPPSVCETNVTWSTPLTQQPRSLASAAMPRTTEAPLTTPQNSASPLESAVAAWAVLHLDAAPLGAGPELTSAAVQPPLQLLQIVVRHPTPPLR